MFHIPTDIVSQLNSFHLVMIFIIAAFALGAIGIVFDALRGHRK
jgi:hypothetical protein